MNKEIHFFDLDRTLWSVDTRIWIIDKRNPKRPLLRLSKEDTTYVLSGVFKKDENKVEYNGKTFWISDDMLEKINKRRKNIDLSDIGVSFIEKVNPEYYKKLKIFVENIRHLIGNSDADVGILSGRYSVDNDHELLKALKSELDQVGIKISKFYYVGTSYSSTNSDRIAIEKMRILLEHLVGFHIGDNKFLPIKQDFYPLVHFYDDEYQNINVANKIQRYFDEYLENTQDNVYERIVRHLSEHPMLYTHLITNNQVNRFKTTEVALEKPVEFPIVVEGNTTIPNFNDFV